MKSTMMPRLIEYTKVRWNINWCKRCHICVEACPRQALILRDNIIIQLDSCDQIGLCEKLCPDLAIEVISPRSKRKK